MKFIDFVKNYLKLKAIQSVLSIIIIAVVVILFLSLANASASEPKFKIHKIGVITENTMGGETRVPAILDYDRDGDMDIVIVDKHGTVFILENLSIP
jgi:hypothetical protein